MKKFLSLAIAALLLGVMASCSSSDKRTRELLETIPADAQMVMTFNMEKTLKDLDCSTKGSKVTLSSEVKNLFATDDDFEELESILKNGLIEPSALAVFVYKDEPYITGFASDADAFKKYMEDMYEEDDDDADWKEKDGGYELLEVERSYGTSLKGLIKGDQFWIFNQWGDEKCKLLRAIEDLDKKDSYAASDAAKYLLESDSNIACMIDLAALSKSMGREGSQFRSALAVAFDEAAYLGISMDGKEGEVVAEVRLFNDKFEPAKVATKLGKIDTSAFSHLSGNCFVVGGLALNNEQVLQIAKSAGAPSDLNGMLSQVGGTFAFGYNFSPSNSDGAFSIAIPFSSPAAAKSTYESMVGQLGNNLQVSGNYLTFSNVAETGAYSGPKGASSLKGAAMGVVIDPAILDLGFDIPVKFVSLASEPDDKGLKLVATVKMSKDDENGLLTMLKLINICIDNKDAINSMTRGGNNSYPSYYDDSCAYADSAVCVEEVVEAEPDYMY